MTERFFFDTDEAAQEAAKILGGLGKAARSLLEECVETQGISRQKVSAAARALENEGFVFVRGENKIFDSDQIEITPSLAGEEALLFLEASEVTN